MRDRPGFLSEAEPASDVYARAAAQFSGGTPTPAGGRLLCGEPAEHEADIPRRQFVVDGYLQRGVLSELIGPGAAGKGLLSAAWGVALALGRPFGNFRPHKPMRVLFFNTEDDLAEQQRRVAAVLRWFGATPTDLAGRLQLTTPALEQSGTLLETSGLPVGPLLMQTEIHAELLGRIKTFKPDLAILDPLVELHDLGENDNAGQRLVGSELRLIARQHDLALLLIHHARKGGSDPGNMDVGRGASSMVSLARKVFTAFPMTETEGTAWNVNPAHFFRLDGAKSNHDAKNGVEWFERHPIELDNGDLVARCEPWQPPSDAMPDGAIEELLVMVRAGERGRPWASQLGRYARSISRAMERAGITQRRGQEAALQALYDAGVVEAGWKKPNRVSALGLRHPDGGPTTVQWLE